MNKKERIKELADKFKKSWKDPGKKAGIKLLGYLIFFLIFILLAAISSSINSMNNTTSNQTTTTTTQVKEDKYIDKQKDLLKSKYTINYVINANGLEYKINGTINESVVEGYLESNDNIKKIILKENNLYEIKNEEEILLELDVNKNLISTDFIINLIKQNSALIEDKDFFEKYTYDIKELNIKIIVELDDENINQIYISENSDTYELNFDK